MQVQVTSLHENAASLYLSGNSLTQTAEIMGVSIWFVRCALRITRTPTRPYNCGIGKTPVYPDKTGVAIPALRTFNYEIAKALYEEGHSVSDVASAVGGDPKAVNAALRRMGVKMRGRGARSGSDNHQFIGGERQRRDGYWVSRGTREKPLQHRVIAETALGRKLKRCEVVHHINCDKSDNRPENLLICTQSYHMQLHARMRRHPYWAAVERSAKQKHHP